MLRRQLAGEPQRQFHAYSAVADDAQTCIETQCIDELSTHPQTVAHRVAVPSMAGMVTQADLKTAAWARPHPTDNSILLPAMMCVAAQREGHRVVLMGTSGDVTMHVPLRYIAQLIQQGHWKAAWQEARGASHHNPYLKGSAPWRHFALNLGLAYAPGRLRTSVRGLLDRFKEPSNARQLLTPELAQRVQWQARRQASLLNEARAVRAGRPDAKRERQFRQVAIAYGLNGFARIAGRYGVELRDPWADRRVVGFFLRLPLRQQIRDGWTKYPVRHAFGHELSPLVTGRTGKEHLGWHLTMQAMEGMGEQMRQVPEADLEVLRPYAALDQVKRIFRAFAETGSEAQTEAAFELLTMLMFLQRLDRSH